MATKPVKSRRLVLIGLAALAVLSLGVLRSAFAQEIFVGSAEPAEAEQGTVNLDVTIHGNGFAKGARAAFLVTGTENPGGIVVNRTTYVNPTKLVANIDVAIDAVVGSFDIEVTSKGRTGKGVDCFSVKESGNAALPFEDPVTVEFSDNTIDRIQSDRLGAYVDGEDRVRAVLVADGNFALKTNDSNKAPVRMLTFDFGNPASGDCNPPFESETVQAFMSTTYCDHEGGLRDMGVNDSQQCNLGGFFPYGKNTQYFLHFGEDHGTTPATVTRTSDTSWDIEVLEPAVAKLFSAPTKGRLVLTDEGNFYMPVTLTVTLLQP
jgi:hypothetical protein